ncbi:hypothetical protein P879_10393, partial [Paragonimus westermani]
RVLLQLDDYLYRYLEKQIVNYREGETQNESTKLMDFVQSKFSCCGVQSAADYGTKGVPRSCGIYTSQNSTEVRYFASFYDILFGHSVCFSAQISKPVQGKNARDPH